MLWRSGRLVLGGLFLSVALALWTLIASASFVYAVDLIRILPSRQLAIAWWLYFIWWRTDPIVWFWLQVSGAAATALVGFAGGCFGVGMLRRRMRLRPARWNETRMPEPVRLASDNHGHAAWLSVDDARALFPGPDPEHGGIVVGEAYRVDRDPVASRCRFDPDQPRTWGQGGKAPLLVDPCRAGATHAMLFAGSGLYKTTSVVIPTLLHWTSSVVVLDPSREAGQMLSAAREAMGHRVVMLDPYRAEQCGFNVLSWIDLTSPLAETFVGAVVHWLCGSLPRGSDANTQFFHSKGKELLTCLLADMVWDPTLSMTEKTLRRLRQLVATPEDEMVELLARIHRTSQSPLARDRAGTLMGLVKETFSGAYAHATGATDWLAVKAYADLVSGDAFKPSDLNQGRLSIFLQLPLDTLKATPGVARVIVGALLNAVYLAEGRVVGRVLFMLDEVARLGSLDILETARDAARKYRITLLPIYQSEGQLIDQWGPTARKTWFDSLAWRAYAGVNNLETAREISAVCGEYGILARSEGKHRGSSYGMQGSSNRGQNENISEGRRALITSDELMHDTRDDEVFIFRRGARPIRCGRAIYFRRPEMLAQAGTNRFHAGMAERP
jgi:type IV secretion system protein VirD4